MLDFFSPENRNKTTRRDYFSEKISRYLVLNKLNMLSVDFNDNMVYKDVNFEYQLDFFEFIYKYITFYIPSENINPETTLSILCLCLPNPNGDAPPISFALEQTRARLGDKVKVQKKEAGVYTAYDRVSEEMTYKNVIDAIKIYHFSFMFEISCTNETVNTINFFHNELDRIFKNNLVNTPNFSYEKEMMVKAQDTSNDPNERLLDMSFGELIKNIENFLKTNSPKSIYDHLCKYIVGQDQAKIQISIGVYYYLQKLVTPNVLDTNTNMLMVGPSGCGKTEIIRVLQTFLPIPVIIYDVASLTCAGYKGDNKDNILRPLVGTDGVALVFLDEFDKICTPNITSTGTNFSYETQGQMLSMIEGNTIPIDDGEAYINTRNTLFIAGGAFENMQIESKKKFEKKKSIGFASVSSDEKVDENSHDYRVAITDVTKYGLRTELAGRFSTVITLYPLTDEELHGVVRKYISYYETMLNKKISFKKDELNAEIKTNTLGCRHIKQIIYDILTPALFEAPMHPECKTVKITKDKKENKFNTMFA